MEVKARFIRKGFWVWLGNKYKFNTKVLKKECPAFLQNHSQESH